MFIQTLTRTLPAIALAVCVCIAPESRSEGIQDRNVPKRVVHYGDLDLSRPEGAQALYKRLRNAARAVCRTDDDVWDLRRTRRAKECFETAMADAIAQVNKPALTAVYRQNHKTKRIG